MKSTSKRSKFEQTKYKPRALETIELTSNYPGPGALTAPTHSDFSGLIRTVSGSASTSTDDPDDPDNPGVAQVVEGERATD